MSKQLTDFDLEHYLPYRLTVVATQLSSEMARHYKSRYGISTPEWRVLLNVAYTDTPSIRDIEKASGLEKSKVSRAVSRLEASGYLAKKTDRSDRRLLNLTLTDEGIKLLNDIIPISEAFQRDLEAALGDQLNAFHASLSCLAKTELR